MREPATRYQVLRRQYSRDEIDQEQFETRVGLLLRYGRMHEAAGPKPPGWRTDLSRWPVPAVNDLPERNLALPKAERLALARALRDEGDAYE